ncbi:NAD(P)H-dependent oxidoreductase [Fructobacillus sp. M1-13]|uniref:NAD(P)H-dependent oxidoreductase n=1 Tax=Fructobacillus papyriferae TaxID=2713171 RepID=A0ABS5QQS9_9LACO|nr:NAD(P)H-dependent oxidoreductase [Fructobacillus papyriferae]MBS9335272.1 NAD(P)H-dependent oxidoreductase [Fructobacillus papyriferae]MCD2159059.1 NAD(P)H-dependent oxidoreductase [Fructobacillus papyriferae]
MNILIVQGHPDDQSFTHSNALNSYENLREDGMNVQIVDLAIADFDPILRYGYRAVMKDLTLVHQFQKKIDWADHICFFFPIWWGGEPALLKGMLDRVLMPGFAYERKGPLRIRGFLKGKKASLFMTADDPAYYHKRIGGIVSRWRRDILGITGMKLAKVMLLGGTRWVTDEAKRFEYMNRCSSQILAFALQDYERPLIE